jgi:hypothetical protein
MKELISMGFIFGFGIMPVTFVLSYTYTLKLIRILKTKHTNIWISLGQPTGFFGNSMQTSLKLKKFIKNPRLNVTDDEIVNIADILKIIKRVHFFAFGLVIACFVSLIALKHAK